MVQYSHGEGEKETPHERLSLTTASSRERIIIMDKYFALREFACDLYDDGLRAADMDMIADQYELESWEVAEVEAFLKELESDDAIWADDEDEDD